MITLGPKYFRMFWNGQKWIQIYNYHYLNRQSRIIANTTTFTTTTTNNNTNITNTTTKTTSTTANTSAPPSLLHRRVGQREMNQWSGWLFEAFNFVCFTLFLLCEEMPGVEQRLVLKIVSSTSIYWQRRISFTENCMLNPISRPGLVRPCLV